MSEIRAILERAWENIRVSDILIHENSPDIAASRDYYAMFYIAEALLLSHSLDAHVPKNQVIEKLEQAKTFLLAAEDYLKIT